MEQNERTASGMNQSNNYDAGGNLTSVDYPGSPDLVLKYDALNRLTNLVDAVGTSSFSYAAWGGLLSEDGPWGRNITAKSGKRPRLSTPKGL